MDNMEVEHTATSASAATPPPVETPEEPEQPEQPEEREEPIRPDEPDEREEHEEREEPKQPEEPERPEEPEEPDEPDEPEEPEQPVEPEEPESPVLTQINLTLATAEQWKTVATERKLASDTEVAAFLLQLYEKNELGPDGDSHRCVNCNKPLPLYLCLQCSGPKNPPESKTPYVAPKRRGRKPGSVKVKLKFKEEPPKKRGRKRKVSKPVKITKRADTRRMLESLDPLDSMPEDDFKINTDTVKVKEEVDSGDGGEYSHALPMKFDPGVSDDEHGRTLSDHDEEDLALAAKATASAARALAKEGKKRGRKPVDKSKANFPCKHCDASFKEAYRLKRHVKIHADDYGKDRSYSCKECRMTFRFKGSLDAHMRKHSGQQPFGCSICGSAFTRASQARRHVDNNHAELATKMACFRCTQCHHEFTTYKKFTTHVWRHTLERKFKCELCPLAFCEPSSLKVHMRIHTGDKPFTCSECGLSFHQLCNLNRHILTHSGERPWACSLCPATYPASQQLKRHMQGHKGEKSFLCQLCGASYTESKSLKYHMRSHTGEKPFKCDVCEKEFARPASLKLHKRTHSCDRPYVCAICGATFADNSNLHRHNRIKHSGKPKKRGGGRGGGHVGVGMGRAGSSMGAHGAGADGHGLGVGMGVSQDGSGSVGGMMHHMDSLRMGVDFSHMQLSQYHSTGAGKLKGSWLFGNSGVVGPSSRMPGSVNGMAEMNAAAERAAAGLGLERAALDLVSLDRVYGGDRVSTSDADGNGEQRDRPSQIPYPASMVLPPARTYHQY